MSQVNNITKWLGIEEENFKILSLDKEIDKKGNEISVVIASFSPKHECCPHCNSSNTISHGFKNVTVRHMSNAIRYCHIKLRKKRFLCKNCKKTFMSNFKVVEKNKSLSNNVFKMIHIKLSRVMSIKDISKDTYVSETTVTRYMLKNTKTRKKKYLPESICIDEFKSVKKVDGAMSFICIDANSSDIIDILPDRKIQSLINYYSNFPMRERLKVKNVVMDIYSPYMSFVNKVFPNAKIILDRFHLMQLFSRAFNKTRIEKMSLIKNKKSMIYKRYKRYWKYLLKDVRELDTSNYRRWVHFKKYMSEYDLVRSILSENEELKKSYDILQSVYANIKRNNYALLMDSLDRFDVKSKYLKVSISTFKKYSRYIQNTLNTEYTNGKVEGTINRIKHIKRTAYGYRSFSNFKARIEFVMNNRIIEGKKMAMVM